MESVAVYTLESVAVYTLESVAAYTVESVAAYLAVVATIALTVCSQILQKRVANQRQHAQSASSIAFYAREPHFWLALASLGIAMLFWLFALAHLEVSKAYALLSINYLLVPLAASYFFKERVAAKQWLGAFVLCAGLLLIGRS